VTIFLALGGLSVDNGLPRFGKDHSQAQTIALESGDAVLVRNELPQVLDKNGGGGFALVSDWNA
jgi:hypothetical protein